MFFAQQTEVSGGSERGSVAFLERRRVAALRSQLFPALVALAGEILIGINTETARV
jgi:hypothetical protein